MNRLMINLSWGVFLGLINLPTGQAREPLALAVHREPTLKMVAGEFAKELHQKHPQVKQWDVEARRNPNAPSSSGGIWSALEAEIRHLQQTTRVRIGQPLTPPNQNLFEFDFSAPQVKDTYRLTIALNSNREKPLTRVEIHFQCTEFHWKSRLLDPEQVGPLVNLATELTQHGPSYLGVQRNAQKPELKNDTIQFKGVTIQVVRQNEKKWTALPFELQSNKWVWVPNLSSVQFECPDLQRADVFRLWVSNSNDFDLGLDVLLDGRTSLAVKDPELQRGKYLVRAHSKNVPITGWIKELRPLGKGKYRAEVAAFEIKEVDRNDPLWTAIRETDRSTILVRWFGAWPQGQQSPEIPLYQSTEKMVGEGHIGEQEMESHPYEFTPHALGSVVIRYGKKKP